MSLRASKLLAVAFLVFGFLTGCSSKPGEKASLSVSNTSGTTSVNGAEVAYEYNGEFYILSGDMLFRSLEDLRDYVANPYGTEDTSGTTQEPGGASTNSFLASGRQWLGGAIPFRIQDYSPGSPMYNAIVRGIEQWQQKTLIRFVPYQGTSGPHLVFKRYQDANCAGFASIGKMNDGEHTVLIASSCDSIAGTSSMDRIIKHEIGHVVGHFHEHQRSDRPNYVDYHEENVQTGRTGQFAPIFNGGVSFTAYDYNSIMHYFRTAWSKNGQPTLTRKGNYNYALGSYNIGDADVYSTERYYMGETPCGKKFGANYCRYKAHFLSSTSPVVYFEFNNTKNLCNYGGYVLSADWHPDGSRVNLTYELELRGKNANGTWTTKRKVGLAQGRYLEITFGLVPGTYRWVYRYVSGRGYIDTYRTDQARCP